MCSPQAHARTHTHSQTDTQTDDRQTQTFETIKLLTCLSLFDDNDNDHLFSHLSLCNHSSDLSCMPDCVGFGPFVDRRIARSVQKKQTKTKCLDPLRVALVEVSQQKTTRKRDSNGNKANTRVSKPTGTRQTHVFRNQWEQGKHTCLETNGNKANTRVSQPTGTRQTHVSQCIDTENRCSNIQYWTVK